MYPPGDYATVAASSIAYPHYVAITLTNSQPSPTTAGLQQEVTFNPSAYSPYESSDLGNIRFCSDAACSTQLYAWLESCSPSCSPSATSAVAWVKLSSTIPANGALQVYMAFSPSGGFDGVYWGEAPQLSGTYGQYDNGANVFNFYDDFAGATLNPKWQAPISTSGGSVSVNDGATFGVVSASDYVFLATASTTAYPQVTETLFDPAGTATSGIAPTVGETTGTSTSDWVDLCPGYEYNWIAGTSGSGDLVTTPGCASSVVASGFQQATSDTVVGFAWVATGDEQVYDAYANIQSGTDTSIAIANYYPYIGISNYGSGSFYTPWVRARAYPPNGVMPSVLLGSVTTVTFQAAVPITMTNSQSSATPNPFQEEVTYNPSTYSKYESWNLGNIRFCSDAACNTQLYAWLESCTPSCSPSATSATAWVRLASSISGGGGTLTVYMEFLPAYTNFDGNYWGEAPSLSGTYGQYDNGASVFGLYFNGNTPTADFNVISATGYTLSQTTVAYGSSTINVLQLKSNGGTASKAQVPMVYTVASLPASSSYIEESVFQTSSTSENVGALGLGSSATASSYGTGGSGSTGTYAIGGWVNGKDNIVYENNGAVTTAAGTATVSANTWYYGELDYVSGGASFTTYLGASLYGHANPLTATNPVPPSSSMYVAPFSHHTGTATGNVLYDWVRVRAYPPNGVMPSVSPGSIAPNYVLAIADQVGSPWDVNLAVASSSNTNRLYNLTIWFYSPTSAQIQLGTGVTQLTTGPVVSLSGSGTLYIALYASSTGGGSSTVTLSLRVRAGPSGPYAQYTIDLQVN